jgi:chloramphenicol-sensitive protein RarD
MDTHQETSRPAGLGAMLAASAFLMWGLFPIYFKQVAGVPAVEVLSHRILWSVAFVVILLTVNRRWRAVRTAFFDRNVVAALTLSAVIISVNWGVFIWAIGNDRVLESSLGYFINPLVSVVLGVLVLGERLRAIQWAAVALAAAGVVFRVIGLGELPWVALTLAVSFGFYGLIRKVVKIDPVSGLFVETLILSPFALIYLVMLAIDGVGVFGATGWRLDGLLALSGIVTALPLILFVAGAQRIRLSTLGLLQYIVPTSHFVLAVFVYHEPFTTANLVTFGCIWLALAIYSFDAARREVKR